MTHLDKLTEFRREMIQGILNYMKSNNLELIEFDEMFSIMCPETNTIDDSFYVDTFFAQKLHQNGILEGTLDGACEWGEKDINELDAGEVAYILDQLEAGKYSLSDDTEEDEDVEPF